MQETDIIRKPSLIIWNVLFNLAHQVSIWHNISRVRDAN